MSSADPGAWAAPLGAASEIPLQGAVDAVAADRVEGWLRDPMRPRWPVIFQLSVNGTDLGRHIANLPARPDTPDQARFSVPLPPGLARAEGNSVVILTLDGTRGIGELGGAPEAAPTRPAPVETTPEPPSQDLTMPQADLAGLLDRLDPAQLVALVEKAFKAEQWTVVVALTEGLEGKARDPRLVTHRGRALFYLGRHAAAVETLRWIQARYPQRHAALLFLARALAATGQLPEARQILANCVAASPDEPRYLLEAGRVAARLAQGDDGQAEPQPERVEEATALLRRAAELRPQDHRPVRALAQLAVMAGRLSEALALLQAAVARLPEQAELRMELARILVRLNRIDEALAEAEAAAALDPMRDGAGFAVRILRRWLDARRAGPLSIAEVAPA